MHRERRQHSQYGSGRESIGAHRYTPSVRILVPAGALLLACPIALAAYREGPLPNMAGGFGDADCHSCHFDKPLNAPGGHVALDVPATYTPGQTYPLTVTLERAGIERGGFEIVARFANGPAKGQQAGTWVVPQDGRLQTIPSAGDPALLFVQHTTAGTTTKTPGTIKWSMEWKAPQNAAPVQFNVAANASNDDASPIGE